MKYTKPEMWNFDLLTLPHARLGILAELIGIPMHHRRSQRRTTSMIRAVFQLPLRKDWA